MGGFQPGVGCPTAGKAGKEDTWERRHPRLFRTKPQTGKKTPTAFPNHGKEDTHGFSEPNHKRERRHPRLFRTKPRERRHPPGKKKIGKEDTHGFSEPN